MKSTILLLFILPFLAATGFAQTKDSLAPAYTRLPVPPFHLLKSDSTTFFTKDDLKKNRKVLLIFFSPECEHCKHQTQDLLGEIDKFKDIEIVMATYQPFNEMRDFYNYYRIADHKNILMGRDEKYVLPPYYKMQSLPFLALYDKKGNFISKFEGNQKINTILNAFDKK